MLLKDDVHKVWYRVYKYLVLIFHRLEECIDKEALKKWENSNFDLAKFYRISGFKDCIFLHDFLNGNNFQNGFL